MTIDDLRDHYTTWFGCEPTPEGELNRAEDLLDVKFPNDFREISKFYNGGMLGGISHNAIAAGGPASNITDETKRLREAAGLPHRFVVLAEPPVSLIVMNSSPVKESPTVIWCDATDVSRLGAAESLHNPQTWRSYTDFFRFLLDAESKERSA